MCWTCENPDGDFAAELIERFDEHEWQLLGVGAGPNKPAYVYTIGLPLRFGHPELIMSGDLETVGPMLNAMAEYIADSGRALEAGHTMQLGDEYLGFAWVDPARLDSSSAGGSEIACSDEVHQRLGIAPCGAVEVVPISRPAYCPKHFDQAIQDWLNS